MAERQKAIRQKTMKRWCKDCGNVVFRTPKGKAAPYTAKDWTDEAGHPAS